MAAIDRLNGLASETTLAIKAPVAVATTANITLAGVQVIDGVTVGNSSERVLVKNQTDARQNGIYIASTGNWTLAQDAGGNTDWANGTLVFVQDGTQNSRSLFGQVGAAPIIIGTSSLVFDLQAALSPFGAGADFKFDGANLSAAVAADLAHAIYVPPASDPTGASGAYVRQFTGPANALWFGFVADGVVTLGKPTLPTLSTYSTTVVSGTDNSQAWKNLNSWARYESHVNGRAIWVDFPAGNYNWDNSVLNTIDFPGFYGIKQLRVTGYGAVFTNTYNETVHGASFVSNPWMFQSAPLVTGPNWTGDGVIPSGGAQPIAFLINTTAIGDNTITLQTAARTSYFSVGEFVLVGSLDIQMGGFPPNMGYNEFVQILDINAGTGVMTIDKPLKFQHRSDFTDYTTVAIAQCGKARVWKLDTTGFGYGIPVPWDIDHTYEGMQVNLPPGFLSPGHYTVMSGRRFRTINWKGVGFSQTTMGDHVGEFDHYWTQPEIDKNINSIAFKDCIFDFSSGAQSSSVERIVYQNCDLGGTQVGAKQTTYDACTIRSNANNNSGALVFGASQGVAGPASFRGCRIETYLPNVVQPFVMDGGRLFFASTDGSTSITFSNGTFILNKSTAGANSAVFSGVPGQYISLVPSALSTTGFPGNLGVGLIISYTEDATNVYMNTTLPYATLPAMCVTGVLGLIAKHSSTTIDFIDCSGSDQARLVSEATAAGYEYWNYKSYTISGLAAGSTLAGWQGEVIAADINVINPSASGSDVIVFSVPTFTPGTASYASNGNLIITVNCGVAGRRIITQAMWLNKTGTDSLTDNGTAVPVLPGGRVMSNVAQWSASSFGSDIHLAPLIKATFIFDTGQCRKRLTAQFNNTTSGAMLPTVGLLV